MDMMTGLSPQELAAYKSKQKEKDREMNILL